MNLLQRAARLLLMPVAGAALALSPAAPALAKATAKPPAAARAAARDATPWLYRGSDVPQDKEWNFGELKNGLRYAVRHNAVPPGQVAIRILIDAGSLYETDAERGYAHLLEHMVFRQSQYLGDGEAIHTWQRMGATFGSDTNAQTSFTQTVYKVDLPAADTAKLDTAFRLLSGMMIAPTLSTANLSADVPIVLAEMRDNAGVGQRVNRATIQTIFAGQPIAARDPIGTAETLKGATQESIRAFHGHWYRPERAVIVVAGDADPAQMAAMIDKWFGGWKGVGKPAAAPSFGDPVAPKGVNPANPVGETRVLVEPDLPRTLSVSNLRPWRQVQDTIVYNQGLMIDSVAQFILNRRLEDKARGGGSYLAAQVGQQDVSRSADIVQIEVTPSGEDWTKALTDVRAVIADALATPPSQEEIDRAAADMDVAFQIPVEQRPLLRGAQLADDIVKAVDIRETVANPETVLSIFRQSIPLFTPKAVLEHTRALFAGTVTRAVYITPRAGEATDASLRAALLAPVKPDGSGRMDTTPVSFDKLPAIGAPGTVAAIRKVGILDVEEIEFANGVKALIYPTRDEPGRVAVKVRFGGGRRAFAPGEAAYAALGDFALVSSGQATLGQNEIDRITTGRKIGFDFDIDDAAFRFSGDTRAADLSDQLYLFASKLAFPRWDENPVLRAKAAMLMQYDAFAVSPQGVLQRDFGYYQHGRDPRFGTPDPAALAKTTPAGFRAVWERVLAAGPIEVQVYGDVDRQATIDALARTFGALPRRAPLPTGVAAMVPPSAPPSATPVALTHRGDADQAAAIISWNTGGGASAVRESRQLYVLSQVFSNRLLDAMREKFGASYAPQVYSEWPMDFSTGGSITAMSTLEPGKVAMFYATAQEIATDLATRPVSPDELLRVVEPIRQTVSRAATGAAFFMGQLDGAPYDPQRYGSLRTLMNDYTQVTPADLQTLAARYLRPQASWRLEVLPEAKK